MDDWIEVALLTLLAGIAMPVGALIARFEKIRPDWLEAEFRHSVVAFGGGALLSAIALVLVPEGSRDLALPTVVVCFSAGGLAFLALDVFLDSLHSPVSQLAAMLSDFIPEALALGAAFASGSASGPLLAGIMALQNLPEGFNAFRELTASTGIRSKRVIIAFSLMALFGPVAGLAGYFWLAAYPTIISGIMYLIFQDIAPQVKLERHWAPPLGALAGFLLGLVGQMLTRS